jgi:hypothetical protein
MFRHVTEALRILTENKLDKLLYDQKKNPNLTLSDMVRQYEAQFRKLLPFNFDLDDVLMKKLDALNNRIKELRAVHSDMYDTLDDSYQKMQRGYEWSISSQRHLGQPIDVMDFVISLYDPEIKRNEADSKCPFRWFEFASNHKPCIDRRTAEQTITELSDLYRKRIQHNQLNITDDCTTNAYELLDYVYTNQLPKPEVKYAPLQFNNVTPKPVAPVPQYVAPVPQLPTCSGLYEFIEAIETYISALKARNVANKTRALDDLAYTFNTLCPKAAYVFFTQKEIFRNSAPECRTLRGVQTVAVGRRTTGFQTTDPCRTNLDKIDFEYLRDKINISVNTSTVRKKGLKGMDYAAFYQKANNYDADIYVRKKIGPYKHENEYTDTPDPKTQYGGSRKRRRRRYKTLSRVKTHRRVMTCRRAMTRKLSRR